MTVLEWASSQTGLEIAVIGMAARFPGSQNIDEFWQNLRDGVESVSFFSDQELVAAGIDPSILRNPAYVKARAILPDIEWFDAAFFNITSREAEMIDPQHRFFLECAWEALENAGYNPETYPDAIGVYGGSHSNSYLWSNLYANPDFIETCDAIQLSLTSAVDFLTTRVSYKLNLRGPSVNISTACSTSLVAVHLACQGLLSGSCDLALAGGVLIITPHKAGHPYQEGGTFSPDGHCRAFDANAKGMVGGNGVGIVVLKRLEEAIADRDCILAVIKGSAINNDGALKIGYTAPSVDGQAQVIRAAQLMAEVDPETITYVEAHGTGTPLGDPIEIAALTQAFRATTQKKGFCAIGSVKTNFGHLDAAAGVAGLIKTVLALKHGRLPPSLHFERPNPKIDFENSPFYVNARLSEWKTNGFPRRAGVSSFGMGGTNAHVVLEQAPRRKALDNSRPWQLLLLAARSSSALDTTTMNLAHHIEQHPDVCLPDVAYTLQVGRKAFDHRRAVVCRDLAADAVNALETLDTQRVLTRSQALENRPVVFMFSGQGAQYVNMGLELYQVEPVVREQIDRCAAILEPHLGLDLRTVLYPGAEQSADKAAQQLKQTSITQPALFVVEYALAQLWMTWGIRPRAMIGHSIGEFVAACLAGVFSLQEALALVAARGQLMQAMPGGAMLAISLSEHDVLPLLDPRLSLAVINAPSRCVISGPTDAVEALERRLEEKGVACRLLHTSHAFHSAMMGPILAPFVERVRQVNLKPPQLPYVSNVTGTWITAAEATDPEYWARHLHQTVRFADGLQTLAQEPRRVLLEVGPGQTLCALAKQQPDWSPGQWALPTLHHPKDQQSDVAFLLKTLGQLWLAGLEIDWGGFYAGECRQRVPLPTYPFERKRYWIEPARKEEHPVVPTSDNSVRASSILEETTLVTGLEQVIEQQLNVMAQQLEVFATDTGSDI